jgi:hypothetical protein
VALSGGVLGNQDVAGAEAAHSAITDLDVDRAGEREHRDAPGRVMPRVRPCPLEASDHDAASGNQLRALRLIAERLEARRDLLEV